MSVLFEATGSPEPGSTLDQAGLRDGQVTVVDYIRNGEPGLALEHLIYMVREAALEISHQTFGLIDRAGLTMGMSPELWQDLKPSPVSQGQTGPHPHSGQF